MSYNENEIVTLPSEWVFSSEDREGALKVLSPYLKEEESFFLENISLFDDNGEEIKDLEAKMKHMDDYNYLGELENAIYSFARITLLRDIVRNLNEAKIAESEVNNGR